MLLSLFLNDTPVLSAKLRTWVGPNYFFEGQLPLPRTSHMATGYGKIYVFGGNNIYGERAMKLTPNSAEDNALFKGG